MAEKSGELTPAGDIAAIRAEMVSTRSEMGHTIDALQTRLAPSKLVDNAKHALREATVGRARRLARSTSVELAMSKRARWTAGAVLFTVSGLLTRTLVHRWRIARSRRAWHRTHNVRA